MKELEFVLKPEDIKDQKRREVVSKSVMLQEIIQKNFFVSGRFEISNIQLAEIKDMVFNVIDEMCNKYHIEIHKDENPKMVLIHILLRYLYTKDTVK